MKNENEEIDRLIEEVLTKEEATYFHELDEQDLFQKFGGLFQGKMKWINLMTVVVQVIQFGFAVYFTYRFFTTTDIVEMIRFGSGAFFLMMTVTVLKIYHWMEINKNATIREIKRMELQVSVLADKLVK